MRIFQIDNNGEILPNLGSDLIPFRQDGEHIDFDDSVIYIKECDGTYTEEIISSGIIDRDHITLFGDFDKSNCAIWLYKAEKNPLAKYYDK